LPTSLAAAVAATAFVFEADAIPSNPTVSLPSAGFVQEAGYLVDELLGLDRQFVCKPGFRCLEYAHDQGAAGRRHAIEAGWCQTRQGQILKINFDAPER
jgi:hypothetical protein